MGGMAGMRRMVVNGIRLATRVEGDGPAILFIHGYPLSHAMWNHQVAALDGWRRIAPDLRGMGDSEAPDHGYSLETYAADMAALLDELGVGRVVLCGHSMGGYVAFECLRRWPERVRALVLVDTRAEADTAEVKKSRDTAARLSLEAGPKAIAEQMLPAMLAYATRNAFPEVAERVQAMMAATPVAGIVGALRAMKERADSTPLLPGLRLPTLVVVGEADHVTPAARVRAMASAIPGARLAIVLGAGHLPPVERPAETTEILREFLNGLPAERA